MTARFAVRRYAPAVAVALGVVALAVVATFLADRSLQRSDLARRAVVDAAFVQQRGVLALTEEAAAVRGFVASRSPRLAAQVAAARREWATLRGAMLSAHAAIPELRAFVEAGDRLDGFFAAQAARAARGDAAAAVRAAPQGYALFESFRASQIAIAGRLHARIAADRASSDAALRMAIATDAAMGVALLLGGALAAALALRVRNDGLLARTDPLTQLPNRRSFEERLAHVLARRAPRPRIAVLFLDLDDFKAINDRFGHAAGDEVLVAFGERLRAVLRPHDLVARVGGDEFAAILDRLDDEDADALAHRIDVALREPLATPHGPRPVAASIGIAVLPDDGAEPAALLRIADEKMYLAKRRRQAVAR